MKRQRLNGRAAKRGPRSTRRLMAELLETRWLLSTAELEPNDTLASATPFSLAASEVLSGDISSLTDVDVFRVALLQGQRITVNPRNSNDGTFNPALPVPVEILGPDGEIKAASRDNRQTTYTAPADAEYYIRFTSDLAYGEFVGGYAPTVSITDFAGATEAEPNNATAMANGVTPAAYFRGAIAEADDVDFFSFTAAAGQAVVVQFSDAPASSPALRLYGPGATLLDSNLTGEGLRWLVLTDGTYYLSLSGDNGAGTFTGQYVAHLSVRSVGAWRADASGDFGTATNWELTTTDSFAIGNLSSLSDLDYFSVQCGGLDFFTFNLAADANDKLSAETRVITLYDDYGHVLQYSTDGRLDTRNGGRPTRTGRYLVSVQATAETGIGPYSLSGVVSSRFNAQRDVPLYFIDFDEQMPHLGFDWVAPYATPAAIPHVVGRFESIYDIYDVDVTLTKPPDGTEMVANGIGDFGDIGAGGYGGGYFGSRRPRGDSLTLGLNGLHSFDDWSVLALIHEAGHATGLPHARNVLDYMGYDNQMYLNPVGSFYPFYGTDSRIAETRNINQRDYLDWALQAGTQIPEVEANDLPASAQDLDPYLSEMQWELGTHGTYDAGQSLSFMVAGDFNHDNRPDLAAADPVDKTVRVFLGNGDGTLQDVASYAVGNIPWWTESLAVGDFNGDGNDDIVAADGGDNSVSVLLARSDGTFQSALIVAVAGQTLATAAADFNGDGATDIAVTTWHDVRILLGNGDGSFRAPQSYPAGGYGIVAGDLNGDGHPDLATANPGQGGAAVLLNNGTGGFPAAVNYPTGQSPYSLTMGDFNGDGRTDLAVGDRADKNVSLLVGNGNGTFVSTPQIPLSGEAIKVRAADVDGNGTSDLLVGTWGSTLISLLGMGDGTFSREIGWATSESPIGVAAVELNGDGRLDLAAATYWGKNVNVLLGQANDVRNDRMVVYGSISSPSDTDHFRFTAEAGATFLLDIDAAEFQYSLDASLAVWGPQGTLIASNVEAIDPDSGLNSVDPSLTFTATQTGVYSVRVTGEKRTAGDFRLKITPEQAVEREGPRVIFAQPQGVIQGARQLLLWTNGQLDPDTLNAANIIVQGATTGIHPGTALFDPLSSLLIWQADTQLPPDSYTVTLSGSPSGIADLHGNLLDGETDGNLTLPEVSGDGLPGGDFVTTFAVLSPDTTAAQLVGVPSYSRHPYNRGLFTFRFTDKLDVASVQTAEFRLRGAGSDNEFETADDYYLPVDVWYDTFRYTNSSTLHVYTRGVPAPGRYSIEAAFLDAAGNPAFLSSVLIVGATALYSGPVVTGVNVRPNSVSLPVEAVEVDFSDALDLTTLTSANMRLYFSSDPDFFDGNDAQVDEADGVIAWDAPYHRATFQPAVPLQDGYYLLELNGTPGGITDARGRLLDGEFLDTAIPGADSIFLWPNSPSGDGAEGGNYRAFFSVVTPGTPDVTLTLTGSPMAEAGGVATIIAVLSAVSGLPVTVNLAFSGIATPGVDYIRSATSITIPADSTTGSITLTAVQDNLDESDETIVVDIDTIVNGYESGTQQVTATITDDDPAPTVTLSLTGSSMAEADGVATITALLSAVSGLPVTVMLAFSGTATPGVDYTRSAMSITIPAGSTTGSITITAVQDALDESDETVVVDIGTIVNGDENGTQQVTATIVDDDPAPAVTLNLTGSPMAEAGGVATVTAVLSAVSGLPVTVNLAFSGTATPGVDYIRSATSITIPAGSTTGSITLTAVQDALDESDETIVVDIDTVTNGTEAGTQRVTAVITNEPFVRFLVVDNILDDLFGYAMDGNGLSRRDLVPGFTDPRGVAAAVGGRTIWVLNYNNVVSVQDGDGNALGSWSSPQLTEPTGIAISGSDIWIVDKGTDTVYRYANASGVVSGELTASSSFKLDLGNSAPEGIAADGTTLWVIDGDKPDRVFVYETSGASRGSWSIDPANTSPTGIAIDPTGTSQNIWIVDISKGRVYEYADARSRSSGSQSAKASFALISANPSPQDIAVRGLIPVVAADAWQNRSNPADVDGNGRVSPLDVLVLINHINRFGSGLLQTHRAGDPFCDVNGDGQVGPIDSLLVINYLNTGAEAEGAAAFTEPVDQLRVDALGQIVSEWTAAAPSSPGDAPGTAASRPPAATWTPHASAPDLDAGVNEPVRSGDEPDEDLLDVLAARLRCDWWAAANDLFSDPD